MLESAESSTAPLRIIHVLRAPIGGLFRHVLDLSREQIARGHQVGLIADSLTGGARADEMLAELEPRLALGLLRIPIHRMPHLSDFAALAKVNERIDALRPDVIHGHGSKGGLFARLAGFPFGTTNAICAYTPHGGSLNYRPGSAAHRAFMAIEWALAWRTDALLFESAYVAERFREFVGPPRRLWRVVRNGVSPAEFTPISPRPDATDLLYVGEFRAAKGLDTLIDALGIIDKKAGRRPKLSLVGSGPDEAALRKRAQTLGVASQIEFFAPRAVSEAFKMGRVMVVPSRAESLPYIVLEAAGARVPLVATNVGGMSEIYGPYSDRLIACDNPHVLAEALLAALDEAPETQRKKAAELAEYVASKFSLSAMVDGIIDAYREAIAARKRL